MSLWGKVSGWRKSAVASIKLPRVMRVVAEHAERQITNYALYGNQARTYAMSSWIHVAISRIAEAAALVPFKVLSVGAGETLQEIPGHPFERLLSRPNDKMSMFELLESTFGFLELTGNAYWYLTLDEMGVPVEIWVLRPDRMEIVPSRSQWVGGYIYHIEGSEIPLNRDEVVHFKRWHPGADYEGLSTIEPAGHAIEADLSAQKWNVNFFRNNAVPGAIVGIQEMISDADYDAFVKMWAGKHEGVAGAHRAAFIRGSTVTVHPLGQGPRDMEFRELRMAIRDEVFLLFGIPLGKYSENATEANANVAERVFLNETLWPKLCRVAEKITSEILPKYGPGLVGAFDDVRWVGDAQKLEELRVVADHGLMTVDEMRARYFRLPGMAEGQVAAAAGGQPVIAAMGQPGSNGDGVKTAGMGVFGLAGPGRSDWVWWKKWYCNWGESTPPCDECQALEAQGAIPLKSSWVLPSGRLVFRPGPDMHYGCRCSLRVFVLPAGEEPRRGDGLMGVEEPAWAGRVG